MTLLVVEPGLKLWGSERAFLATLPDLVAEHKTVVVLAPPGAELIGEAEKCGAVVETGPIGNLHRGGKLARLAAAFHVARACRRFGTEKIYLNQAGLCRLVHWVARLLSLPTVVHVRLVEDVARCAKLKATAAAPIDLVFVSSDMRQHYPHVETTEKHKRLFVAYDPFEFSGQEVSDEDRLSGFICVGRIAAIKGQLELVEALGLVRDSGKSMELHVVGSGAAGDPYEEKVKQRARDLDLTGAVNFHGYRTDIADLIGSYRYLVAPSRYEPLGRVVFEAWDGGALPICSRDSGGAAEIVTASGGGLLYDGHDPQAIAEAMGQAVAMAEDERIALVAKGRAWAGENLSLDVYREALCGVLFSPNA